ncbi:hypothetical protein MauCBS54593_004116 [Microsporum audouinii]
MFRCLPRTFVSSFRPRGLSAQAVRHLHDVTGDFTTYNAKGVPISKKVDIAIGDPENTFVLVPIEVGSAFKAAATRLTESTSSPLISQGPPERCKVMFFHDSQHFSLGPSSYPQLRIPANLPRQTGTNTSPATIYLDGVMNSIVLDGTPDARFTEMASASALDLKEELDDLKNR